jgi:hypothetical protein
MCARQERLAASPGTVALVLPLVTQVDVQAVLPSIRVPGPQRAIPDVVQALESVRWPGQATCWCPACCATW